MSITIIKTYDRHGGKVWTQSLRPLCHPDLGTRFCNLVCAIQQQTKDLHRQRKDPIEYGYSNCAWMGRRDWACIMVFISHLCA